MYLRLAHYLLYSDGQLEGKRKPLHTVGQGSVLQTVGQWQNY